MSPLPTGSGDHDEGAEGDGRPADGPRGFGFGGGGSGSGGSGSGGSGSGGSGSGGSGSGGSGSGGSGFPGFPGMPGMPGVGEGGDLGAMFAQLGRMLSWKGTGVNWDLARDVARQAVSAAGDRSVSRPEREAALAAVRLAEVWLDAATSLPASGMEGIAWSRAEWVEGTLSGWRTLVDPVAEKVVAALGEQLPAQLGELAPGLAAGAAAGPMSAMLRQLGGALFGTQIGQAIGALAGEVVATGEIGIPVADPPRLALLPANVTAFGAGLEIPADDVRLYLALREAAVQRLYTHVPWLRAHVVGLVERFGRGVVIDTDKLRDAASNLDPTDPQALQEALGSGLFEPERTPAQEVALSQLETVLALVEGWVDEVVSLAAADRLPSAIGLAETIRRRRALGGPAEQTFGALVGLDLRPRRMREAAALWRRLRIERGVDGRDAVWAHPDLLPTPSDLDDPQAWDGGLAGLTLTDADLDALRDDPPGDAADPGAPGSPAGGDPDTGPPVS